MVGVLLPALVNNLPIALTLESFLRLDGPAQFRQSFESRRGPGPRTRPVLAGLAPGGLPQLPAVGMQVSRGRWYGSPSARHACERLVEAHARLPHLPAGLVPAPPAERFILHSLRCSLVVEGGAASGLGGVARRCAGPTASALAQVSAVLFRERQTPPGVGQFARAVRRDRPGQLRPLVVQVGQRVGRCGGRRPRPPGVPGPRPTPGARRRGRRCGRQRVRGSRGGRGSSYVKR